MTLKRSYNKEQIHKFKNCKLATDGKTHFLACKGISLKFQTTVLTRMWNTPLSLLVITFSMKVYCEFHVCLFLTFSVPHFSVQKHKLLLFWDYWSFPNVFLMVFLPIKQQISLYRFETLWPYRRGNEVLMWHSKCHTMGNHNNTSITYMYQQYPTTITHSNFLIKSVYWTCGWWIVWIVWNISQTVVSGR